MLSPALDGAIPGLAGRVVADVLRGLVWTGAVSPSDALRVGLTILSALDVDLGELDHPWLDELRRVAPTAPLGQKRILSIGWPLVYRLRASSHRAATWVDEEHGIVWLCAVHWREEVSDDDAYAWFAKRPRASILVRSRNQRSARMAWSRHVSFLLPAGVQRRRRSPARSRAR